MNKRAMISQPMAGKTDEEIAQARDKAHAKLREMGYEFVNTLFTDEWYSDVAMKERGVVQIPLCYLAKSLENMSLCHGTNGFECSACGCRVEDCEGYYVKGTWNFCPKCRRRVVAK